MSADIHIKRSLGKKIEECMNNIVMTSVGLNVPADKTQKACLQELKVKLQKLLKKACDRHLQLETKVVGKWCCSFCKKYDKTQEFLCGHYACQLCVLQMIREVSEGRFDDRVWKAKCPKCSIPIGGNNILGFYSYEALHKLNEDVVNKRTTFKCQVCLGDVEVSMAISLPGCEHYYHIDHFREYLNKNINCGKVSDEDMICPVPTCKKRLTSIIIQTYLTPAELDKYTDFRLKMSYKSAFDRYKHCALCNWGMFIGINAETFSCKRDGCQRKGQEVCAKCDALPHHKGMTCAEYVQAQRNSQTEKEFREEQKRRGCQCCPACGQWWQKMGGCNCMTCKNPKCRAENKGKYVYFCYVCGTQINGDNDSEHYTVDPNLNFGRACNNIPNPPPREEQKQSPPRAMGFRVPVFVENLNDDASDPTV